MSVAEFVRDALIESPLSTGDARLGYFSLLGVCKLATTPAKAMLALLDDETPECVESSKKPGIAAAEGDAASCVAILVTEAGKEVSSPSGREAGAPIHTLGRVNFLFFVPA
jgi:hypothetical protein